MEMKPTDDTGELVALLSDLIAAPSVNPPGNEIAAVRILERYLQAKGLEPQRAQREGDRCNLLCRVRAGSSPTREVKTLLLTSHLDVVPADDLDDWHGNPFQARVEGSRIIGRGACDAKGQLAAMALATTKIAACNALAGDILFLAVFGEEHKGLGSKAAVAAGVTADAAVVGEPTGNRICIAHPGRLQAQFRVTASTTHPSKVDADRNTILAMGSFLSFLRDEAPRLEKQVWGHHGPARLVPFHMGGGDPEILSPPLCASMQTSLWFGHPLTHEDAIGAIQTRVDSFAKATGISVESTYRSGAYPAGVDIDTPIVCDAATALRNLHLHDEPTVFGASCDMYVFTGADIPSIILGPGHLAQCHAANESVRIDELATAAKAYQRIAEIFLKGDAPDP